MLRQERLNLAACYRILDVLTSEVARVARAETVNLRTGAGLERGLRQPFNCARSWHEEQVLVHCLRYAVVRSHGFEFASARRRGKCSYTLEHEHAGYSGGPQVLEGAGAPDPTAFYIHSRIHLAHPHAACVLHTHMPYATSLCCLENMELKMIHQNSCRFFDEIAYDTDYQGLVLGCEEGDRLATVMGNKRVLLHSNHGVITCGETVAEAFDEMYYIERAAQIQILAMSTGQPLRIIDDEVIRDYKAEVEKFRGIWASKHFEARRRCLLKAPALGNADYAS